MAVERKTVSLRGARILIVEDDFVVARSLEHHLTALHCEVVGMAPTVAKAKTLAARQDFDIAVLDIQLRDDTVTAFAEALHRQQRPFVFLTCYSDLDMLPEHLRGYPYLEKPIEPDLLTAAIAQELQRVA